MLAGMLGGLGVLGVGIDFYLKPLLLTESVKMEQFNLLLHEKFANTLNQIIVYWQACFCLGTRSTLFTQTRRLKTQSTCKIKAASILCFFNPPFDGKERKEVQDNFNIKTGDTSRNQLSTVCLDKKAQSMIFTKNH
jgi:hypothetical protein